MIRQTIIDMIKEELDLDTIDTRADLVDEYEIDSITLLDFFMNIEEEFDIEFEDEELEDLKTVEDVVELVEEKSGR